VSRPRLGSLASRWRSHIEVNGQTVLENLLVRTVTSDPLKINWPNFTTTCIMTRRRVASQIGVSRFKVKVTHRRQRTYFFAIRVMTVSYDPIKIIWPNLIHMCIMTRRSVASQFGVSRFKVKVTHRGQRSTFWTILLVRTVTSEPLTIILTKLHSYVYQSWQGGVSRPNLGSHFMVKITHRCERSHYLEIVLVRTVTSEPLKIIWPNFIDICA
jgi:hypothetical protein